MLCEPFVLHMQAGLHSQRMGVICTGQVMVSGSWIYERMIAEDAVALLRTHSALLTHRLP